MLQRFQWYVILNISHSCLIHRQQLDCRKFESMEQDAFHSYVGFTRCFFRHGVHVSQKINYVQLLDKKKIIKQCKKLCFFLSRCIIKFIFPFKFLPNIPYIILFVCNYLFIFVCRYNMQKAYPTGA